VPDDEVDIEGGRTLMEVAFGAGDGDDDATAVVAKSQANLGTIFNQSYRPWDGELGPRWMRNYAISATTSTVCSPARAIVTTTRWCACSSS